MPILLLAAIVVIFDQWSKFYVQTHMHLGMSIPLVENVFHLTYVLNPGAAFGMLEHRTSFFIMVAALLVAAVVYFYPRIPPGYVLLRTGMGLQVGGAIGNLIDRVKTGYVVDFFDFRIWPVFNIADIAIVSGVGMIIFSILRAQDREKQHG
ncbi:MAG: signal peptidase II [Sporomusaceae bacterium]|nr:signal peptidase II [Sporomusaceae bacterium]